MDDKITFSIIVFNGDFVLKQVLESIYPFAYKIVIAEGPVGFWVNKGHTTSADDTNKILDEFPDPEKKIEIIHGQFKEKTEMCQAWFKLVPKDTDYVWCVDGDEVYKQSDIKKVINLLEKEKPSTVGFQSNTFFGGFDHIMTGFERRHSFKRILKYVPGCEYVNHRPPTICVNGKEPKGAHIKGEELFKRTGVEMYHYSYLSPKMVHDKIKYYEQSVIKTGDCIPGYFKGVWLRWVCNPKERKQIEDTYNGVHEFRPQIRGAARTAPFTGSHPEVIQRDMKQLKEKFYTQLKLYVG